MPLVRIMAKQCLISLDYLHRICQIIHTDLKPENVSLCLTEEEVKEIASKGQLTTTKMFDLPDELKKISAGKIETQVGDQRGRCAEENEDASNLDRAAKRALKKRKYKERKKEAKRQAQDGDVPVTKEDKLGLIRQNESNTQRRADVHTDEKWSLKSCNLK